MKFMPPPPRCWITVGLSLALAACDTPPTLVDQHFGMAVQRAQTQQSLQAHGAHHAVLSRCPHEGTPPNCPSQHLQPHQGMGPVMNRGAGHNLSHSGQGRLHTPTPTDSDGASALAAVTQYQQSFKSQAAPPPIFNIGLGAVSAR